MMDNYDYSGMDLITFNEYYREEESPKIFRDVYLVLDGMEYKVCKKNGNINFLIEATDPMYTPRTKYLDIRGLGLLRVLNRKIKSGGSGKRGIEYYIMLEQWRGEM